ncbi:MAG: tripartite tricarboxylate transporter substrate binding protein [Betaproteobacteria bacterium]
MMKNFKLKYHLFGYGLLICLTWISNLAMAQDWPSKPIKLIVPVPAGTGPDVDIRQISKHMSIILGQPIVVENRPGAAARIGVEAAIRSAPDGYTFLVGTPSMTTMKTLYPKLSFDPQKDLIPVSLLSITNYTLAVNAQVPAKTLTEYVKLAKSDPKYANIGTLGMGAINHLSAAWFSNLVSLDANYIHYSSTSPFTDLASGQLPVVFDAMLTVMNQVKAGRVRMLAISGKTRQPLMPDVPTFAEAGLPTFDPMVWVGILAPAGTPIAIVNKMSGALSQVAKMPETVAARKDVGSESIGSSPEEFASFLDSERTKWSAVIKKNNLVLE